MNTALKIFGCLLLLLSAAGTVPAQQPSPAPPPPAAKSSAQIDAGEPRANSVETPADPPASPATPGSAVAASGHAARRAAAAPRAAGAPAAAASAGPKGGAAAADRLNLNTATVTGDREQPKVMYIVPWKSSNIGDLSGKPMNSLLDEALAPVDREEFKREVAYYDAVKADAPQKGAQPPAAKQGEK
jgi:hypothetical protein